MTAVMDRQSLHLMSNNGMLEVIHRVNDTDAYYIAERHQLGSGTTANVKR